MFGIPPKLLHFGRNTLLFLLMIFHSILATIYHNADYIQHVLAIDLIVFHLLFFSHHTKITVKYFVVTTIIYLMHQQRAYMVTPKFPRRSPKLILRTPLETAFWKTPTQSNAGERINKLTSRKEEC